jgi:hypothetical protein
MTVKQQLEEKAEDAGSMDALRGVAKYTSLAKKSPYNYAYEKGYAAGVAEREKNEKLVDVKNSS